MRRFLWLLLGVPMLGACSLANGWTANFLIEKDEPVATGRNPYFILEPGYQLVLEGGGLLMTITVLNETKMVDGVETRVVVEHETRDGQLLEVSRNYYAISKRTNDVFYFGEDVDIYKNGQVVSHAGAWLSGVNGAKFGLMMPGQVLLNAKYYNEVAPGAAMDRAEIVSVSETVTTPAGTFTNCVKIKETSPLTPFVTDYKYYGPRHRDGAGREAETGEVRKDRRASGSPALAQERVAQGLAGQPDPALISTISVERQNLTVRMCVAAVHSAHQRLQQEAENLKAALPLHFAWHNLMRVHRSLR